MLAVAMDRRPGRFCADKNRKLRTYLTFKGYEVIETETGEAGVRLAHERRPSLVLMDIRVAGIDGSVAPAARGQIE